MVEEIRNKWCEDLEDLLQCPICMNRPASWVYQCMEGHHICVDCKTQLMRCPTCNSSWSPARNRLAESLCLKLDDIKLSLIDPDAELNKLLIPDRVSVASQTDGNFGPKPGAAQVKRPVDAHSGPYPCRIGACGMTRPFDLLMKHITTCHANQFVDLGPCNDQIFQHSWFIECTPVMIFDRAFRIPDMGIFFLKLSTDVFENFTGYVVMLHNGFISSHFTYQLELNCCADHTGSSFTGEMNSCRTPTNIIQNKSLHISRAEMYKMTDHAKMLNCTLLIGKKPISEHNPPKPNAPKKKNTPRNKKYAEPKPTANGQDALLPTPLNNPFHSPDRQQGHVRGAASLNDLRNGGASYQVRDHGRNFL